MYDFIAITSGKDNMKPDLGCTSGTFNYLWPPDVATMLAVKVVSSSTGMQDPSGGVSPGTSSGCDEHNSLELNTMTRNWRGTLLSDTLDPGRKSSICNATAYPPS